MNDRVRPLDLNVETRGVDKLGNGTGPIALDIRVMVDGVRAFIVGEGGKTKRVCDGVGAMESASDAAADAFRRMLLRR